MQVNLIARDIVVEEFGILIEEKLKAAKYTLGKAKESLFKYATTILIHQKNFSNAVILIYLC